MATDNKIGKLFEEVAQPDNKGFSQEIDVIYNNLIELNITNGSSYSRNASYLYNKYYLIKTYKNGIINSKNTNVKNSGIGLGKLLKIKLNGLK